MKLEHDKPQKQGPRPLETKGIDQDRICKDRKGSKQDGFTLDDLVVCNKIELANHMSEESTKRHLSVHLRRRGKCLIARLVPFFRPYGMNMVCGSQHSELTGVVDKLVTREAEGITNLPMPPAKEGTHRSG